MSLNTDGQVAIYIDYENLTISYRKDHKDDLDWSLILETAVDLGRVAIRRAYADWSMFKDGQREMLGMGIDLVHVPGKRGKNAADIRIVMDVMEMLAQDNLITHVVLVSGDGDFTELVHKLRASGKEVVGIGVSGASAEYLINACDQFVFYNTLQGATVSSLETNNNNHIDSETTAVTFATAVAFDISEARQLLRRALQRHEGEWVSAGKIKSAMRGMNPAFSERNYGFANFKSFLQSQNDMIEMRTAEGGHLEVQKSANSNPASSRSPQQLPPEAVLDQYLNMLAQQKIRMTPNEHRPQIILRYYSTLQANPGKTLNEIKEETHAYFEETAPFVKYQYVNEVAHQLFHTRCFEFDQDDSKYSEDTRLWDKQVMLESSIKSRDALLDKCDLGLLQRIVRKVGSVKNIDREVAARLLYGSVRGDRMLTHIDDLIDDLLAE